MVSRDFWKGKRVFVTGHTGFKGSWLGLWLDSMGAIVKGYSLPPPTLPNLFEEAHLIKHIDSIEGDIRHSADLSQCMSDFKPELVIHMAAQSLVRRSYDNPLDTYSTNVMGTVSVFEAVRNAKSAKVLINVTSDKCYENQEWFWGYREIEPMGGYDPYSCSKGCAELITASYRRSFFNPNHYAEHGCAIASVRAGNVIGGGDWATDRLVPDLVRSFINDDLVKIRNPLAIRPWQHVLEPLSGYLMLAQRLYLDGPDFSEGWNFGPKEGNARPVKDIADYFASNWSSSARYEIEEDISMHEAHYLKLDCSKAKSKLGWEPILTFDETLNRTIDWYKARLQGANMHDYCLSEINDYMNLREGV